jgi:hypothetical protein
VQRRKEGSIGGSEDDCEVAYGDDREEFEFAAQFPDACAPVVRLVTDPIHALVFGGKPRYVELADDSAAPTTAPAASAEEPESAAEADARRARAARGARLLEEKLKSANASEKPRDDATGPDA